MESPMEWLRLVGSLKFQVSFTGNRLVYRALLQKRPIILRSLIIDNRESRITEMCRECRECRENAHMCRLQDSIGLFCKRAL